MRRIADERVRFSIHRSLCHIKALSFDGQHVLPFKYVCMPIVSLSLIGVTAFYRHFL